MISTLKNGLTAAAFGMLLSLSAFSAEAASLQSSAVERAPVAKQETKVRHDLRTTGSVGQRTETTGSTMPYMMSPKKPLNMDCKLGFNPTSSSSCNY